MRATKKRWIFIACIVLISAYFLFGLADCIRLRKSVRHTRPIITLYHTSDPYDGNEKYYGLGYSIEYSIPKSISNNDGSIMAYDATGSSAHFVWLGIPIWGWEM